MVAGDVVCDLTNALPKRCASFDGADDYILLDKHIIDTSKPFTLTGNIKNNGFDGITIFDFGGYHRIFIEDWKVGLRSLSINTLGTTSINRAMGWVFITICYTGTQVLVYVNGALETTDTRAVGNSEATLPCIGAYGAGSGQFFNGMLRNFRVFDRVLNQAEITKLYQGLNVTKDLVGHWKLTTDYKDSVGDNDGTNSGSRLAVVDDQVAEKISDARVTPNDKYLMAVVNNKLMTAVIEEAP